MHQSDYNHRLRTTRRLLKVLQRAQAAPEDEVPALDPNETTTSFVILKTEHSKKASCSSPIGNDGKSLRTNNLPLLDWHQDGGQQAMQVMAL